MNQYSKYHVLVYHGELGASKIIQKHLMNNPRIVSSVHVFVVCSVFPLEHSAHISHHQEHPHKNPIYAVSDIQISVGIGLRLTLRRVGRFWGSDD